MDEKEKDDASQSEELEEELEEEAELAGSPDSEAESEEEIVEPSGAEEGQDGVDFKSELQKERERLGKKVDTERKRRIQAQRNALSREEVEEILEKKVRESERRILAGQVQTIAARMAKTDSERELILFHYEHSIIPSGNIEEDLDKARALANRKRTANEETEKKRISDSKDTTTPDSGAGAPKAVKPKQKYSQDVLQGAKIAGVAPEEFVKKLEAKS